MLPEKLKTKKLVKNGKNRVNGKFTALTQQSLFNALPEDGKAYIKQIWQSSTLSHQQMKILIDMYLDFKSWGDESLPELWQQAEQSRTPPPNTNSDAIFNAIRKIHREKQRTLPHYSEDHPIVPPHTPPLKYGPPKTTRTVYGDCPARSEKTVCCNLKTIDAVFNCGFGCSYCCIQSFYSDGLIQVPADFRRRLAEIKLDRQRRYHIGTGQSSDSLMWGDANGALSHLTDFARANPNVILEFKTKSKNVSYFLKNKVPPNIFCSWSLNTRTIIENEEHLTASLEERLTAARRVADRGIRVAFHIHPIICYAGWEKAYTQLVEKVISRFAPHEVLFVSMGTLHFIKPVIRKIRTRDHHTKILQAELVQNPEGKFTYPIDTKALMYRTIYKALTPWHNEVFFYICMEVAALWYSTFGYCYETNAAFEKSFIAAMDTKLNGRSHSAISEPASEAVC